MAIRKNVCIDKDIIEQLRKEKLQDKQPEERLAYFNSIFGGDKGLEIARLFDNSLLLKKQELAFDRFINNADIKLFNPELKAQMKKDYQKELFRKRSMLYNSDGTVNSNFANLEKTEEEFINFIKKQVSNKYKLEIPKEDLNKIASLKREVNKLDEQVMKKNPDGSRVFPEGSTERLALGMKINELNDLVNKVTEVKSSFLERVKAGFKESYIDPKTGKKAVDPETGETLFESSYVAGVVNTIGEGLGAFFNPALKSIKASLDASGLGRQGQKVFGASPKTWLNMVKRNYKTFSNMFSRENLVALEKGWKADIVTRDLYEDAIESGLRILKAEDFFPESFVQGVKGLGLPFKASDDAFTMSIQGARMELFEKYVNSFIKNNNGVKPPKKMMEDFARVANSVTGSGGLGTFENSANLLNKIFFSARYQTAQINTLKHAFDTSLSPEARKIARKNLAGYLATTIGLLSTFSIFGDVGLDPREGTFGKVRLHGSKKWVDVTGGLSSYIATPIRTIYAVKKGTPAFGQNSGLDILFDFMKGKFAPAPGLIRDILEQKTFENTEPTIGSSLRSLFSPITFENISQDIENKEEIDTGVYSFLLEFIGASVSQPKSKREGSYKSIVDIISGN